MGCVVHRGRPGEIRVDDRLAKAPPVPPISFSITPPTLCAPQKKQAPHPPRPSSNPSKHTQKLTQTKARQGKARQGTARPITTQAKQNEPRNREGGTHNREGGQRGKPQRTNKNAPHYHTIHPPPPPLHPCHTSHKHTHLHKTPRTLYRRCSKAAPLPIPIQTSPNL